VGTVDKFQGRQVFYAMTTSSAEDVRRSLEFVFSRNRLNVGLARRADARVSEPFSSTALPPARIASYVHARDENDRIAVDAVEEGVREPSLDQGAARVAMHDWMSFGVFDQPVLYGLKCREKRGGRRPASTTPAANSAKDIVPGDPDRAIDF
jgi:hypothetical protein